MLNAAEAAMDQAAEDDAERQRNRMRLYAPPKGQKRLPGEQRRPPGVGMTAAQARAQARQIAADDAQIVRRTSG